MAESPDLPTLFGRKEKPTTPTTTMRDAIALDWSIKYRCLRCLGLLSRWQIYFHHQFPKKVSVTKRQQLPVGDTPSVHFSTNSFSYRGSYFKYRGEGSKIVWICFFLGGPAPRFVKSQRSVKSTCWLSYVFIHRLPGHPWNPSFIFLFLNFKYTRSTFVFMFVSCLWISMFIEIEICMFWIGLGNFGNGWYLSMLLVGLCWYNF